MGVRSSLGQVAFYSDNKHAQVYREILSVDFSILPVADLTSTDCEILDQVDVLVIYQQDVSSDVVRAMGKIRQRNPNVKLVVVVDNTSLESALVAMNCQAIYYFVISDEKKSLNELIKGLLVEDMECTVEEIPGRSGSNIATKAFEQGRSAGALVMKAAAEYIDDHLDDQLLSQDLASAYGLGFRRFLRLFKQEHGIGFRSYIKQRRVERARYLLRQTEFSVKRIAYEVGFSDSAHFVRVFRQQVGMTPGSYRIQAGE